jgi:hypothetical protein
VDVPTACRTSKTTIAYPMTDANIAIVSQGANRGISLRLTLDFSKIDDKLSGVKVYPTWSGDFDIGVVVLHVTLDQKSFSFEGGTILPFGF